MRYLGLDYGSKTLGVSVSDETELIASNICTIRYKNEIELFNSLNKIISEYKPNEFVLGLPLNMNGTESVRSGLTKEFKKKLENYYKLPVNLQDERFSTTEAQRMLISNGTTRKKRKQVIDGIASVIILQTFLDKKRGSNEQ